MISFIIPARDEEKYIAECLKSIYAQGIAEKFEVIVVDNNSTDATAKIVKERFPGAQLIHESVSGTNPARQAGFAVSRGEIAIFLDADVRLPTGWVNLVVRKIRSSPDIVAISGPYHFYDFRPVWNFGNVIMIYCIMHPWNYIMADLLNWGTTMIAGNMVIQREALEKIGGMDKSLKFFGDDTMTGIKLKAIGRVLCRPRYWVWSSARRFKKKGVFKMIGIYWLNYFWILFKGRPYHKDGYELER